jgi:hypothetical protein
MVRFTGATYMKWTTQNPTSPGWYFWRRATFPSTPTMVRVRGEAGHELSAIFRDAGSLCDGELIKFLEAGEWAGPVEPPP